MAEITPEMKRFLRVEIRKSMSVILQALSADSAATTESIDKLYPGAESPTLEKRPIMRPWGLVSRAPRGTLSIIARQGDDNSNRLVLGHRDAEPPDVDEGETKVYSIEGYTIFAAKDGIYVTNKSGKKVPLVIGDIGDEFFGKLLDLIVAHVHPGPGSPPNNATDFVQLKTEYVTGKKLLSTKDGGLG